MSKWLDDIIDQLLHGNSSTRVTITKVSRYEKPYRLYTITLEESIIEGE